MSSSSSCSSSATSLHYPFTKLMIQYKSGWDTWSFFPLMAQIKLVEYVLSPFLKDSYTSQFDNNPLICYSVGIILYNIKKHIKMLLLPSRGIVIVHHIQLSLANLDCSNIANNKHIIGLSTSLENLQIPTLAKCKAGQADIARDIVIPPSTFPSNHLLIYHLGLLHCSILAYLRQQCFIFLHDPTQRRGLRNPTCLDIS